MTVRFYIDPMETIASGPPGRMVRRAKYVDALGITRRAIQDYGQEPTCVLAADVSTAQHSSLSANADVTVIPANLDLQVGANLATVQANLEALNIPSDMVTPATSYRQILRGVIAVFSISASTPLFGPGVTLDTTLGALLPAVRAQLKAAAESAGYDYTGLTLASTIRDALKRALARDQQRTMLGVAI
jgi:hypothetical protein